MADSFNMSISKIRHQMKKDRRHNANALRKSTIKLYATLAKNAEMQAAATHLALLVAMDALRLAKSNFASRLGQMHSV